MYLSICTLNIAHNRGPTGLKKDCGSLETRRERLDQIAWTIKNYDVVALQEVDFRTLWTPWRLDQRHYLQDMADFPYCLSYGSNVWQQSGLVILSRFPVSHREVIQLPAYSSLESKLGYRKNALACTVTVKQHLEGGKTKQQKVSFVNVHLDHRGRLVTAPAAESLVKWAEKHSLPVIMAGDFNATPLNFPNPRDDKPTALDLFRNRGCFQSRPQRQPQPTDMTHPTTDPRCIIDWILIPNQENWRFIHYEVLNVQLSDHLPVSAEVAIPNNC